MDLAPFHDRATASLLLDKIIQHAKKLGTVRIMEVCGTHSMEIGRLGLRPLLPSSVHLISGPGCPVCVTPGSYIDAAADLALSQKAIVATFGDMIKVPGDRTSLFAARAAGGKIEIVTSPLTCIDIAKDNPDSEVVFCAVGFETTIPVTARLVLKIVEQNISNCSLLVSHRTIPHALAALASNPDIAISGFMLPGHASTILGEYPYNFLNDQKIPSVITGFEPLDILAGIVSILEMLVHKRPAVINAYQRIVRPEGNPAALALIDKVYTPVDAWWRGIGMIPQTGLELRAEYAKFDAAKRFGITLADDSMPDACSCGSVLLGKISPNECPLFGTACTPDSPIGPCMVSSEGSCAAYYKYPAIV